MKKINLPWKKKVFIIAEAGVNHNGDLRLAKKLIDVAAKSGADAVKFQTWKPGEITGKFAYKVNYLKKSTDDSESRYELSKRLALPYPAFRELQKHARKKGILFLSTPDGFESLNFLVDELRMPYIKVGSTEVTHLQFLKAIGSKRIPVILSTGLSTLAEVRKAIQALHHYGKIPLVVLHCTSEYPAPDKDMNIKAMQTMEKAFHLPVGLSDHSTGSEAAIAAVAMGAVVVEKHFTLDKEMIGPDHRASLNPDELTGFVQSIRRIEKMIGHGIKKPTLSEVKNMNGIRRSVVAKTFLKKGIRLKDEMLICKRPGTGIQPEFLEALIGKTLKRDLLEDEPIHWKDVR